MSKSTPAQVDLLSNAAGADSAHFYIVVGERRTLSRWVMPYPAPDTRAIARVQGENVATRLCEALERLGGLLRARAGIT